MEHITGIKLSAGSEILLNIAGAAASDRFILKGVDGLGPPDVDVAISNGFYQGRKARDREIEIKIGLNPDYTVGERPANLRNEIYSMLTPSADEDYVIVTLQGATQSYYAKGWVRRCVPVPFSKDPEVMVTFAMEKHWFTGATVFYNTPELATWDKNQFSIFNEGSHPSGFRMQVRFLQATNEFRLSNPFMDRNMTWTYSFQVDDTLTIYTDPTERAAYRTRGGGQLDVSGLLSADSKWLTLGYQENSFSGGAPNTWAFNLLEYTPKYWGV